MGITDADVIAELQAGIVLLKKVRLAQSNEITYLKDRLRRLCQKDIIAIPSQLADVLGDQKQVKFPDKLDTRKA